MKSNDSPKVDFEEKFKKKQNQLLQIGYSDTGAIRANSRNVGVTLSMPLE